MAEATEQESPETRLYAAGFTRQLDWWVTPDGSRVMTPADAIAALDAGEVKPYRIAQPMPGAEGVREHARIVDERMQDAEAARARPPEPPPLPPWAEPLADLVAERLKPVIRSELRKGRTS